MELDEGDTLRLCRRRRRKSRILRIVMEIMAQPRLVPSPISRRLIVKEADGLDVAVVGNAGVGVEVKGSVVVAVLLGPVKVVVLLGSWVRVVGNKSKSSLIVSPFPGAGLCWQASSNA